MSKLTPHQKRLVEDNIRLAHKAAGMLVNSFGIDRDDATSDAMLALVRAAQYYRRGRGVQFSTYYFQCARRAGIDAARSRARRPMQSAEYDDVPMVELSASINDPAKAMVNADFAWSIVERLEPNMGYALVRWRHDGATQREIAGELGVSRVYVQKLCSRAIARAREIAAGML